MTLTKIFKKLIELYRNIFTTIRTYYYREVVIYNGKEITDPVEKERIKAEMQEMVDEANSYLIL